MDEQDIEALLKLWGNWARGAMEGQIRAPVLFRTPEASPDMMSDDFASVFDPAVASLRASEQVIFDTVRWRYVYRFPMRTIAEGQQRSLGAVYSDIATAKMYLLGYLRGLSANAA